MALSRAVGSVPHRNVLVLGGDLNSAVTSIPSLVGRGLLSHSSRAPDREFQIILEEHRLCLLNTWGERPPFRNHNGNAD